MARRVFGRIIQSDTNDPIPGALVTAWDKDTGWDNPDKMADDKTDSDGDYSLRYRKGNWDPQLDIGSDTAERPDIYITVALKDEDDDWWGVATSTVHSNHRRSRDLRIDLTVPPDAIAPYYSYVRGSIITEGGEAAAHVPVDLFRIGADGGRTLLGSSASDADGVYIVRAVLRSYDRFKVRVWRGDVATESEMVLGAVYGPRKIDMTIPS